MGIYDWDAGTVDFLPAAAASYVLSIGRASGTELFPG